MVDLMSGGRVEVCVGRGNVGVDFDVFAINRDEGQERTVEGLEVMCKAWTGSPFSHHGQHYHYENLTVWPRTEQQPRPPIWFPCSNNPESFAHAGQQGYKLLTVAQHRAIEELADRVQVYLDARRAAGFDLASAEVSTHYQVYVDTDGARARQVHEACRERYDISSAAARRQPQSATFGIPVETMIAQGRVIAGTPDECVDQLAHAQDVLGLTTVDGNFLFGGMPYEQAERSLRLFGGEVIPALRDRQPGWRAQLAAA
jgi:alkanesulfonate monooxygenase SsuD/methylene tetrahydromethanopterin reductase-like flavin-dependent oxidoreductase (luciferase family)